MRVYKMEQRREKEVSYSEVNLKHFKNLIRQKKIIYPFKKIIDRNQIIQILRIKHSF